MAEIIDRLGEINVNNKGTSMKIVAYRSSDNIDVEFLDNHHYIRKNSTYSNFIRGNISNPYDRTVYGMGYLGEREDSAIVKHDDDRYACWQHMIERCYLEKKKDIHSSYYGISEISEEWQCYANFANWYDANYYEVNERLHLDKDILYQGNKIYSSNHCLLVPQRINMLFSNKPNKRGLPNGISRTDNGKYTAKYGGKDIGTYPTLEEAYAKYAESKEKKIKEVADEYKDIIPEKVYKALYDYRVRIENDKNYVAS